MGILGKLFNGHTEKVEEQSVNMETPKVNLEKSKINLEKTLINLSKEANFDMSGHRARVAVVLDYSGSMSHLFSNNRQVPNTSVIQETITRLMPIALRFDDNGEMEFWLFSDGYARMDAISMDNYSTYVDRVIRGNRKISMSGTEYGPVLKDVLNKYFIEDCGQSDDPVFVIFITDGDNSRHDKKVTNNIIIESAKSNIFIQFLGIGHSDFEYLEKLDDLPGRVCDNTGFEKVADLTKYDDEYVYSKLIRQYIDWLKHKPK